MQSVAKSIERRIAELLVQNKSKNMKEEQVWLEVNPGIRWKTHTGQQFSRPWIHQATSIPFDVLFGIGTTYTYLVVQYSLITLFSKERIGKWIGELKEAEMKMWYSVYLVISASERNKFDTTRNLPPQWAPTLTSHKQSLVAAILSNVVAK